MRFLKYRSWGHPPQWANLMTRHGVTRYRKRQGTFKGGKVTLLPSMPAGSSRFQPVPAGSSRFQLMKSFPNEILLYLL
jgi:hypothetical protein